MVHNYNIIFLLLQVRSLVIFGTIKYVPPTQQWYYLSCNTCPKGVIKGDTKCRNDRCKDKDFSSINRFRILIRVQDPTGIIDLILWDMDVVKIFKVTAHDLVDRFIKGVDSEPFPSVVSTLLGKKYAFKIDIKKFNVDRQEKCFGITKFSDDEKIISALEKKFNLDQYLDVT
ncbi:replication protein A 70 kDa DNA-binding subunit B-like [Bidens hawaiensis]|uniref:replication protein A 70 kDa DNA-binding subunit B-like n=1 Tax=Bidens hawaiensis TaxID=980011 RepID=UPI00404AC706